MFLMACLPACHANTTARVRPGKKTIDRAWVPPVIIQRAACDSPRQDYGMGYMMPFHALEWVFEVTQ